MRTVKGVKKIQRKSMIENNYQNMFQNNDRLVSVDDNDNLLFTYVRHRGFLFKHGKFQTKS